MKQLLKKPLFSRLTSLLVCTALVTQAQSIKLTPVWETDTTLRTPESVLVDPGQKVLYVACINGTPTRENQGSYLAKLGLDGRVIQLKFTDGLNSTKGMGILGTNLYVSEMAQIAQIDLATGTIRQRYPVEGAKFLNDITIDTRQGIVYCSDSDQGKIWALTKGKISLVLAGAPLKGTNGLLFDQEQLLIGNGDGSLLSLNPTTKKLTTVASGMGGIDGIVALGNKQYLVTEWGGKIWHVRADGTTELSLDTSNQQINSADIGYDPATRMLFVPTFFHNTVKAYRLD